MKVTRPRHSAYPASKAAAARRNAASEPATAESNKHQKYDCLLLIEEPGPGGPAAHPYKSQSQPPDPLCVIGAPAGRQRSNNKKFASGKTSSVGPVPGQKKKKKKIIRAESLTRCTGRGGSNYTRRMLVRGVSVRTVLTLDADLCEDRIRPRRGPGPTSPGVSRPAPQQPTRRAKPIAVTLPSTLGPHT